MYDRSRLTRLITAALVSCAATWAVTGTALARPGLSPASDTSSAPAFTAAAGDTNKAPIATSAPAFTPAAGDTAKTPDPRQVQRVLNGSGRGKAPGPVAATKNDGNDDTGTVALVVALAAMLMAIAAMSLIATRQTRPVLRS